MKITMRNVCLSVISSCLVLGAGTQAALINFSFDGALGSETGFAADSQPANATVSEMTRGSGLLASSSAGGFSAKGWTTASTVDLNDYFAFSIAAHSGYTLALTQLILDEKRSGTGITQWSVRSSVDGFNSDLATFSVPDNSDARTDQLIGLPASEFTGLQSPVEFRIYGFGAESAAGTWRIDNVRVDGSVSAANAVPTSLPSGFAALSLLGIIGLSRCRFARTVAS